MAQVDIGERFRAIVEEGIGRGDVSVLEAYISPDLVEHQRGIPQGLEGSLGIVRTLHRWMTDFSLTVEDMVVSGDAVWTRNRARGINTAPVMGFGPSNRPVEVDVIDIGRFKDGKLVEHWGVPDQLGLLLQIGFDPRAGRSAS